MILLGASYKPVSNGEGKEGENSARAILAESLAKAQEVRDLYVIYSLSSL